MDINESRKHFQEAYSVPSMGWYFAVDDAGSYTDKRVQACWNEWQRLMEYHHNNLFMAAWHMQQFRTNWEDILQERNRKMTWEC